MGLFGLLYGAAVAVETAVAAIAWAAAWLESFSLTKVTDCVCLHDEPLFTPCSGDVTLYTSPARIVNSLLSTTLYSEFLFILSYLLVFLVSAFDSVLFIIVMFPKGSRLLAGANYGAPVPSSGSSLPRLAANSTP